MIDRRTIYERRELPIANLSASIDSLELRRAEGATFEDLVALSKLLFVRGDVLGRIADHDRAEVIATEAIALSPDSRKRALHSCAARGAFPSVRGSERASRSSARGRLSDGTRLTSKGRRYCRRRDDTKTRWFCVKDWQRTIPGFTPLARSRRCWRKWVDGPRQKPAMRPRSTRTMACRRSRAANCCSNGA